jgi:hypothetical protein
LSETGLSDTTRRTADWTTHKERGNRFWLGVMSTFSRLAGRRASHIALYAIALYFLFFARKARIASQTYLSRVLGRPASFGERYRHILAFATTVHDRLYLLADRFEAFEIDESGVRALHDHYATGQGLLLFGAHLGSFEVLRTMARSHPALRMSMAMYPENAREINRTLSAINPHAMQDIIPLGTLDAMLAIHDRLQEGALVGVLADRAAGPDVYCSLPFLGREARFPCGPFRMAALLGHPVYFMTGVYLGANRYRIIFERLDAPVAGLDRQATERTLMEHYVQTLERHCRAYPFNWFNFYDFWEEH